NLNKQQVTQRIGPVVDILRTARPQTPILLVEDRTYSNSFLVTSRRNRNAGNRQALKQAFTKMTARGVRGLHYLDGTRLLGSDGEDTVDGSHPTDLGFQRHAAAFQTALAPLLSGQQSPE
ncbi:MAG: SGNH/GDSL hydrolase family protein, partial [Planctomycetaceae bacterium]